MVERYGEICSQQVAAKILGVVPRTVARMMEDRDYTREEAEARYESQIHPERQIEQATIVIMNDGTITELYEKVVDAVTALEKDDAA